MNLSKWDISSVYPVLRRAYSNTEVDDLIQFKTGKDQVEENFSQHPG
jgi:hypothetical protein